MGDDDDMGCTEQQFTDGGYLFCRKVFVLHGSCMLKFGLNELLFRFSLQNYKKNCVYQKKNVILHAKMRVGASITQDKIKK
jgi:hypothetical protein